MRLFVKALKGSVCEVTVASCAQVLDVKQQLQVQVSIPVDQQKLVYQGKALTDTKHLSDYKIVDGAKLFLVLKKPEGGVTPATASPVPSKSPDSVSNTPDDSSITDDPVGFWGKLSTFLRRHFTERDAARVLREFQKEFDKSLNAMSLDDVERLAAARIYREKGYVGVEAM